MKKTTVLLAFLSFSLAFSQQNENFYEFTKSTITYSDLVNPTSMNNGTVWQFDYFGPFNIAFPVHIFGSTFDQIYFEDDLFYFKNSNSSTDELAMVDPSYGYLVDRGFANNGTVSLSNLSYKIDGNQGNRILKLEAKNVGLEDEEYYNGTTNLFLNYQIWLYESDKSIEFRYGNTNITNNDVLEFMEGLWLPSIGYTLDQNSGNFAYVEGDVNSPLYSEIILNQEDEPVFQGLSGPIASNTMYRFTPKTLSIDENQNVKFSIYPNPATDYINIQLSTGLNTSYTILDISGRIITKGAFNNVSESKINISNLSNGSYVLKIGNTSKKFIKK